jgi:hypothetical protein
VFRHEPDEKEADLEVQPTMFLSSSFVFSLFPGWDLAGIFLDFSFIFSGFARVTRLGEFLTFG